MFWVKFLKISDSQLMRLNILKVKLLIYIKYSYHHVSFKQFKLLVGGSKGLYKDGKGYEAKHHIIFYYLYNITNIRIHNI